LTNDLLVKLEEAFSNRDLAALKAMASPKKRKINKNNNFKSVLMLSCNNIKHLKKIEQLDADCVMLNLEDGVSPEDKPFALYLCAVFLSNIYESNKKIVVRINALDDGGMEELRFLNSFMPDAIRVPKIKYASDVDSVLQVLDKNIDLHLSIETKESWLNLAKLKLDDRVKVFYLGILDLFADMSLSHSLISPKNPTILYMLSHFLITCKSMDIKAVSFVYQEFKKLDQFKEWLDVEKSMGYDSKGCISPDQAKLVNEIFSSEKELIKKAQKIIKLFELNSQKGITGFSDEEYGFIDEPIYKGALAYLDSNN